MSEGRPEERPWKRIARLTIWLCLVPPVGLWKLWEDKILSGSAKWRILIYLFLLPALLYATISIWMTNTTLQRLAP